MIKALAVAVCAASLAAAEDRPVFARNTQAPPDARYEIVEAVQTFRLDRFTGEVARLFVERNVFRWEPMEVPDLPVAGDVPRFQIRSWENTSGIGSIFLIDTATGQTWAYTWRDAGTFTGPLVWKKFEK